MKKYRAYDYMELVANAIDKVLKKKCIIIFFGSILTDRFGRTSDIDVAVYCGKALSDRDYLEILEEIERLPILREVDLVDIYRIKDVRFLESILTRGKMWRNIPELSKDLERHLESLRKL